jgi:hypothetical protein
MEKVREIASFFAVNIIIAFTIISAFYAFIKLSS